MRTCADWVAQRLEKSGFENIQILETARHPSVYADWLHAPGKPTVLLYGHFDVQPVDPIDEWNSDPFTPEQRGENLYARGASDMKGQVLASLMALAALHHHGGGIPVNIKVLIEGEEEIGSPNLGTLMEAHKELLACDVALNPDAGIISPTQPSVTYGLRGLAYFELWVHGAESDLHSGIYGGAVHNPAQVLADLVSGMHDADGRITLPGYYDKVRTLPDEEREAIAKLPLSEAEFMRNAANPPALFGEKGYSFLEHTGARPTLEVNGLYSGFIGEGAKTVLPAKAMAKISMRLVPYQDPELVEAQLRQYLEENAPNTVTWELKLIGHGAPAVLVDRHTKPVQSISTALETTFGVEPVFKLEGGSIPVVGLMQEILGVQSVITGFGLPDDGLHGPNEKIHLPTFFRGIETLMHFFVLMGE